MTRKEKIISLLIIITLIITECGLAYVTVEAVNEKNTSSVMQGQPPQQSSGNAQYSAQTEITDDTTISNESYSSKTADENAVLVSGAEATLDNITVTKTGDSDGGDNTSFYGTNSGIIAKDGAKLTIKNSTVTTNATGANGVFSYGGSATTDNTSSDSTEVNISNSTIVTKKDNSGGIMTTGGGIMNATDLTVKTYGTSSAAIRSDRGGGTVNVNGGTYTTNGQGSPSVYSTADISVKNAKLVSNVSEGVVIEGKNSVNLENCELNDNNTKLNGQSTTYKNIFLYQSMSGDADTGTASFTAKNCKITTQKGDTLYVTNTAAEINLENNTISNTDSSGYFLRVQKDSWGNSGSNGGAVELNMKNQKAKGNVCVDSISTLTMSLSGGSYYEGTLNSENSAKELSLKLDSSSKIKLTGDSYVSTLDDEDTTYSNIDFNGYTLYVGSNALKG